MASLRFLLETCRWSSKVQQRSAPQEGALRMRWLRGHRADTGKRVRPGAVRRLRALLGKSAGPKGKERAEREAAGICACKSDCGALRAQLAPGGPAPESGCGEGRESWGKASRRAMRPLHNSPRQARRVAARNTQKTQERLELFILPESPPKSPKTSAHSRRQPRSAPGWLRQHGAGRWWAMATAGPWR